MTGSPLLNIQDPGETQGYSVDWTAILATGESISTSTWAVTPGGPTTSGAATAGAVTSVDLAGVTLAGIWRLENLIVTSLGRTMAQSITVRGAPK